GAKWCGAQARRSTEAAWLLRRSRKQRQLLDVAPVVLDDDGRIQVLRQRLEAVHRRRGLRAVVVEPGLSAAFIIFAEVEKVAGEQHRALVFQPHQQRLMSGRV